MTRREWTSLERRRAFDLRRAGWNCPAIARALDRTASSIRKLFERNRACRPKRRFKSVRRRFLALHQAGLENGQIARKLRLALSTVRFWLGKLGLAPNPRGADWGQRRYRRFLRNHDGMCPCLVHMAPKRVAELLEKE